MRVKIKQMIIGVHWLISVDRSAVDGAVLLYAFDTVYQDKATRFITALFLFFSALHLHLISSLGNFRSSKN